MLTAKRAWNGSGHAFPETKTCSLYKTVQLFSLVRPLRLVPIYNPSASPGMYVSKDMKLWFHSPDLLQQLDGNLHIGDATREYGHAGSMLDTQDLAGSISGYRGALRAAVWLFKSDQADGFYAVSSLLGSMAKMNHSNLDAIGGAKLVKPLMWVLRNGDRDCKFAAARALKFFAVDSACRYQISRVSFFQFATKSPRAV